VTTCKKQLLVLIVACLCNDYAPWSKHCVLCLPAVEVDLQIHVVSPQLPAD
jgi:hypothetical protein